MKAKFTLPCKNAKQVSLQIGSDEKKMKREGDIWQVEIDYDAPFEYNFLVDGKPVMDPYSKAVGSSTIWKEKYQPKSLHLGEDNFDWQGVERPKYQTKDLIIYEMHVRGFTQDPSSNVEHKGTFLGMIEKIPYLKSLGVNAVELMPIQEFDEGEYSLCNYWGYSTVNFFTPMNRYASSPEKAIEEFKTLVRELHRNDIEVILDIVFNHTSAFLDIDPNLYYIMSEGHHTNYTGCGHTVNLNHPILRDFVKKVLHYWENEMQVDGFRFDLASIMNRDETGTLLDESPLIKEISNDPKLKDIKLIAEPWDIGGYQLGGFSRRWSEWNGSYRDTVRSFLSGDASAKEGFIQRITGSHDLFSDRTPAASINFITCHDGFSLRDLVSYNQKHNEQNGEDNRDGADHNISWNMGAEGETDDLTICDLRERQMRNMILALMISKGTPMLYMGDEYGHTKKGNNNTWCQDNELNWFSWGEKSPFTDFVKKMIRFRKENPIFHSEKFMQDEFHFSNDLESVVAFSVQNKFFIAFNVSDSEITQSLPKPPQGMEWKVVVDTSDPEEESCTEIYALKPYSSIILKAS